MTEKAEMAERKNMTEDYYPYIKNFFRKWARAYDVIIFLLAGVRGKVVDFTGAGRGARVLDIATGTGRQAFAFAKQGYPVTGIDLSEDMLKIARKNNKYENVQFQVGDATRLPLAENSFDVACVSFALHDMPLSISKKTLEEMVRVTRPGGIITVVDYDLPKNRVMKTLAYLVIKSYESKYYPAFVRNDLPELLKSSGIRPEAERSVFFGIGRIIRGTKGAK